MRFVILVFIIATGCAVEPPDYFVPTADEAEDGDGKQEETEEEVDEGKETEEEEATGGVTDSEVDTGTETSFEEDTASETETADGTGIDNDNDTDTDTGSDPIDICPDDGPTHGKTIFQKFRILEYSDDAEEVVIGNDVIPRGSVYLDSTDLEMTDDSEYASPKQVVGIRFAKVDIPRSAEIKEAYIQFVSDNDESARTNLTIAVEASDDAKTFEAYRFDISRRSRVSPHVVWNSIPPWRYRATYHSPDLSSVIQKVIDRAGWKAKNAIVVIIEGVGIREAVAYDQSPADAATLHVSYCL